MDRTSQSPKYIATLALVSSAILILGWLARPREVAQGPPPLPSESELAQLARRAERRSLDSMATYFAGTADDVEASIVSLPGMGASGVAWDPRTIVTAPLRRLSRETLALRWANGEDAVQPTIWGPRLPLAAMSTGRGLAGLSPTRRAPVLPQTGSWVVAVWRSGRERAFASGTYLQTASISCDRWRTQEIVSSLTLTDMMAGGGLYDVDGGLLGVILPCAGRFAALSANSIDTILAEANSFEQQVLARHGLVLGALSDDDKPLFETTDGVMIREVWAGYDGDAAGIRPGDVIVAVDGAPVTTVENAAALAARPDDDGLALTLQRGSKQIATVLAPKGTSSPDLSPTAPPSGLVWESPSKTYAIEAVVPGSRAATAGIQPGDRLVRMNRSEPGSLADVRRVLASDSSSPVLLEVERTGRRVAVILR